MKTNVCNSLYAPRVQNVYFYTAQDLIDAEGHMKSCRQKIFGHQLHTFLPICRSTHYACVGLQSAQAKTNVKSNTVLRDLTDLNWFLGTSTAATQVSEVQHTSIALVSSFKTRSSTPCKVTTWHQRLQEREIQYNVYSDVNQTPRGITTIKPSNLHETAKPSR